MRGYTYYMSQIREWAVGFTILFTAVAVLWFFMIRPYTFEWTYAGKAQGTVKTLMSNQTVIGTPAIKAIINLKTGGQTIIDVPIESDVRAGSEILLSVQMDANNHKRKRYAFFSPDHTSKP